MEIYILFCSVSSVNVHYLCHLTYYCINTWKYHTVKWIKIPIDALQVMEIESREIVQLHLVWLHILYLPWGNLRFTFWRGKIAWRVQGEGRNAAARNPNSAFNELKKKVRCVHFVPERGRIFKFGLPENELQIWCLWSETPLCSWVMSAM